MTPEQARALKAEVEAVAKRSVDLTSGMDADALLKRPPSGGWSVAENLHHLILTAHAMLPLAETAIADLERDKKKAAGNAGLGFMGWLLIKAIEPPARVKSKTTKPFEPVAVGDPMNLLAGLQAANAKLEALIDRATGLGTTKVTVVSPFNASVKYKLYAALRIVLCHTRRHLWQAEQVKASG